MTDPLAKWLDELEAKAKAATPGPWEQDGCKQVRAVDHGGMRVGIYPHIATAARDDDAAYFRALDPATVTALVRVVRAVDTFERSAGENHAVAGQAWSDTCDALNALRALVAGKLA